MELVFSSLFSLEYKLDFDVAVAKLHEWVLLCFVFCFVFVFLKFQYCTWPLTCARKGEPEPLKRAVPEPLSPTSSHHYKDPRYCFSEL